MKVSVVMATYNGEKYLDRQIQSILSQTLEPDEIIVCDDASTDNTVAILDKYQQKGQLTYVVNDHRLGFVNNFKKAVSLAADTNYVSLSDQDDEWLPDKLEKSIELLAKINDPEIPCLVYADLMLVDQDENILNNSFLNELRQDEYKHNLQTLLFGNFVTGCTVLMNQKLKKLFNQMPDGVAFHDGWIALIAFTFGKAEIIPSPLVRYRKHESNVSISNHAKPQNRYLNLVNELISSIKGENNFLTVQLKTARGFYDQYHTKMLPTSRLRFEEFLALQHKSYLFKKLAFRKAVNSFRE